jgi:hypothetical protein
MRQQRILSFAPLAASLFAGYAIGPECGSFIPMLSSAFL